jgi:type VI secretion system secreted protein VgrG
MIHRVFELSAGPYGAEDLVVVRFQGKEEISRLSSFDVTVAIPGVEPDRFQSEVLGAAARLSFHAGEEGRLRRVHGIVRRVRAEAVDPEAGVAWYTLRLVPRMWLLGQRKTCRIFQDRSVPEIVGELLRESGVEHEARLGRSYQRRPYCVQYHETDLHFVERLLAEEGIFYLIEDPAEGADEAAAETVVLGDHAERYLDVEGERRVEYRAESGMHGPAERIHRFSRRTEIRSGVATVKHFDLRRPTANLSSRAEARVTNGTFSEAALRIHDYDGELEEPQPEPRDAEIRLEQERMGRVMSEGESRCRRLVPGRRFELAHHPHADLNQSYVVFRVEHEGHQPEAPGATKDREVYKNRFLCLPAGVSARPRRPERRWQQVVETALVVGPAGEEIHIDELGRIKVQFHWDREGRHDDRSSCWIRVMQAWAGAAWGFQFIPRVGMEVVVAFSGGDVDRPLVLGCAYDGVLPPPFPLPKSKTQSGIRTRTSPGGDGYNELAFEDAAGRERVHVHAQRDLSEVVEHDHTRTVRGDENVTVDGKRDTTIAKDHVRTVLGNEVVTIEKNLLVHVVGRQVIQVDGRAGDGPAAGGAKSPGKHAGGGPPPTAEASAPDRGTPAVDPVRALQELRDATLLFRIAHLEPDLQAQGARLEAEVANATEMASSLRDKATQIADDAKRLVERAKRGEGRWIDLGPTLDLSDRAAALHDQMSHAIGTLTQRLVDARSVGEPRLAKAKDAAAALLRGAITEVERLKDESSGALVELRKGYGLPDVGGIRIAPAPRVGGVGTGGGGATTGFQDAPPTSFLGPPDNTGMRMPVVKEGGSIMDITGGGQITSADGFKISTNGCVFEMSDGIVTLNGDDIALSAGRITLVAKVVQVRGDTVQVLGDAGVSVDGGFIKLN